MNKIFIQGKDLRYNSEKSQLESEYNNKKIVIPKEETLFQVKYNCEKIEDSAELAFFKKAGITVKVLEEKESEIICSHSRVQEEMIKWLKPKQTYNATVIGFDGNWMKLSIAGIITEVSYREISSARMYGLDKFFEIGQNVVVKVIRIEKNSVFVSIKRAYPSLNSPLVRDEYDIGKIVRARLTEPANEDGWFAEFTPAVCGIVDVYKPDIMAMLKPNMYVNVVVKKITPRGIRADLLEED